MAEHPMKRGAREANEESDRLSAARRMGEAVGSMTALVAEILDLRRRVEALEGKAGVALPDGGQHGK